MNRVVIIVVIIVIIPLLAACSHPFGARHFAGPLMPSGEEQGDSHVVGDDHSITFQRDRLEVSCLPMTSQMLNRQFPGSSMTQSGFREANPYAVPQNPYTYGDWKPPGEDEAPDRFSVFLLRVKNYAYPKVRIDPARMWIESPNGRVYQALSQIALTDYYWPYAVAYSGNARATFMNRRDILRRTMFPDDFIFSGQEVEGFVVFPPLDRDVEKCTLWVEDMALRFNYRGDPIELLDIPYRFEREVYVARQPRPEVR